MDRTAYQRHLEIDRTHFWREGKRELLRQLMNATSLTKPTRVLDIGGAASLYPEVLAELGAVTVVEPDAGCVAVASEVLGTDIRVGSLPDDLGVDGQFGLITLLDVLEHIEDDVAALRTVRQLLEPGGQVILTVPALPVLFSDHDRALHHFRRYTKSTLCQAIEASGLRVQRMSYWTSLLLPVVAVQRGLSKFRSALSTKTTAEYAVSIPSAPVNLALAGIMKLERRLLRNTDLPLGSSLLAVLSE